MSPSTCTNPLFQPSQTQFPITPTHPFVANLGVMKLWASKFCPTRGRNHCPGSRVLVSVQIVPGGPHLMILPLTALAISEMVQRGEFDGEENVAWGIKIIDLLGKVKMVIWGFAGFVSGNGEGWSWMVSGLIGAMETRQQKKLCFSQQKIVSFIRIIHKFIF